MKQLRCISIISIILFFYVEAEKIPRQSVIKLSDRTILNIDTDDKFIMAAHDDGCECINYDCGCCTYIVWNAISLNGKLCANASYLEHDYGISLTLTFNNFCIINETVSARNPPPICAGEDIVDALEVEICLRIYDIDIESDKFHACFEILGKVLKLPVSSIKLGCVDTKLHRKMQYIIDNTISNLFINVSPPVDSHRQEQMIAAYSQGSLPSHSLIEVFLFFIFFYWISVILGTILYW
nr:PREDICTED: uncharacterized protein LOC105680025 isoform X1 [Linepithema humile]XP_012235856.1 PREDICTED: uncharacterized protein LOC105680025 isoform X1 [Linepithema humile]XP_012235857.1 PREDICTED: uncharacterized protein LOC105680025 isoform X1 [Linepithema humile]XP_012235858.1 PREDICTED: uncharacterized protein LOC105680025 isoform X1 [Linepithema humile]XP_012235859.1 PREDICTED: uncharacterized protein LOC105680025 isoform X1 [Linepithema humile]XP_012235860.1 PREDICTED: uncharacterize